MKENCKNYNDLTICNENYVVELTEDYCITSLIKNKIGNCTQVNNEHVPTVEEIGSDILLLNQYNGIITANDQEMKLNGTYLLKYFNVTVNIGGREYFSRTVSSSKPLPAALQPRAFGTKTEEVLSLERLQKLNIKNIERLEMLETKNDVLTLTSTFVIISTIATIAWITLRKKYLGALNKRGKAKTKPIERAEGVLDSDSEIKVEPVKRAEESLEVEPASGKKQTSIYNLHTF